MDNKNSRNTNSKWQQTLLGIAVFILIIIMSLFSSNTDNNNIISNTNSYTLNNIPVYSGTPYVTINNNKPHFTEEDYTTESFEIYSKQDLYGRCGVSYANICKEIMPSKNDEREDLKSIPTGWKQETYESIVDGDYLYHRCHLIGWQLSAENDNELNLITGTQYMNVDGMLPFENKVDNYFEKKGNENNHVLYRVTPIFEGNNLVASRSSNGSLFRRR